MLFKYSRRLLLIKHSLDLVRESIPETATRMRILIPVFTVGVRKREALLRTQRIRKDRHAPLNLGRCRTLGIQPEALQTFDQTAVGRRVAFFGKFTLGADQGT